MIQVQKERCYTDSLISSTPLSHSPHMSSLSYQPHAGPSHVAFPYDESTTSALSVLGDQLPVNRGPNDIYDEDTHGLLTETQLALQLYAEDLQLSTMIAELTIEDVAELQGQQMGKGRDDASPSDAALALELCAEEAQLCIRIQNDHLFALKIHEAENGSSSPAEEITTPQTTVRPDTPRYVLGSFKSLRPCPFTQNHPVYPDLPTKLVSYVVILYAALLYIYRVDTTVM